MDGIVLLIEDEEEIAELLRLVFEKEGFRLLHAASGERGLEVLTERSPRAVLLDLGLPGIDGMEVCRRIRASSDVPVIMLTARGSEDDRIRGLGLGADDYVVKPFSPRELIARVEAVLRRSAERPGDLPSLRLPERSVSFDRLEVTSTDGTTRKLSELEGDILRYLAVHRGRVITRGELIQRVWKGDPHGVETRTVDMHISRLREKVEADPSQPRLILTVRAKGYRMAEVDEALP